MGTVVVTRRTQRHDILMAVFLLDVFCLGVKNADVRLVSEGEYKIRLQHIRSHERLKSIPAACAKKLVEGAEAYARELGFTPHKDYHAAKKILEDIETAECSRSFEFGYEGKPLYFAGPFDNQAFRNKVIKTLTEKLGPEGFDYIMPLDEISGSPFE